MFREIRVENLKIPPTYLISKPQNPMLKQILKTKTYTEN